MHPCFRVILALHWSQYFFSVTLWGKNESALGADQVIEVGDNMFMIESETNSDDYYSVDMR